MPSLLIDQGTLAEPDRHVGTLDLDLGLQLAVLDGEYRRISERLREAGFGPDRNEQGQPTRQRWRHADGAGAPVEFLIPPPGGEAVGGRLQSLESDFAAVVAPGLGLAFLDRARVRLSGRTLLGETVSREVSVCGPGAYVVLKALAFEGRGANKDAYDIFFVLQHLPGGLGAIAAALRPLCEDPAGRHALEVLRRDFRTLDGPGPVRVGEFLGGPADELRAQVVGLVDRLLREVG